MKPVISARLADINSLAAQRLNQLQEQLTEIAASSSETIVALTMSIDAINVPLNELRDHIHQYSFQNPEEEIKFFKEIKPELLSQLYYHQDLLDIKLNEPSLGKKAREKYYQKTIRRIEKFIKNNLELFRYCITNDSSLDDKYFMRNDRLTSPTDDKQFNTGYDNKVAKILANLRLKEYLLSTLHKTIATEERTISSVTWTASKVSLIELLYALHCSGSLNQGKTDIKQIAICFESLFQIKLGNYYRVFQDIRIRKTGRTFFLDQLKQELIHYMDEMD